MEVAISLAYAGLEVKAEDADYSTYKELGLLCKCCRQPVFLVNTRTVGETKRKLKNGDKIKIAGYKTAKYFAHFDTEKKECSVRINNKSNQLATRNHSKNQRLKHFQAKIKEILLLNPRLVNANILRSLWTRCFEQIYSPSKIKSHLIVEITKLRSQYSLLLQAADEVIDGFSALDKKEIRTPQLHYLKSDLEISLHGQIVHEAIAFLISSAGYETFSWLYQIAIIEAILIEDLIIFISKKYGANSEKLKRFLPHVNYIAAYDGIFGFIKYSGITIK